MRILVYGDSNSWGYLDDGSGQRYENRWPVVTASALAAHGTQVELVEECLPGRTTSTDDAESPNGDPALLNGTGPLAAILLSQQPLDHIMLMLGTNDMKVRFGRDAAAITAGVMQLAAIIKATPAGHGGWDGKDPAPLTVICPPELGTLADDPKWIRHDEWRGGRKISQELPAVLGPACAEAPVVDPAERDEAHVGHGGPVREEQQEPEDIRAPALARGALEVLACVDVLSAVAV